MEPKSDKTDKSDKGKLTQRRDSIPKIELQTIMDTLGALKTQMEQNQSLLSGNYIALSGKMDSLMEGMQKASQERETLTQKIQELDNSFQTVQTQVQQNTQQIQINRQEVQEENKAMQRDITGLHAQLDRLALDCLEETKELRQENKELKEKNFEVETEVMRLQLEQASFCMRIQNYPEHREREESLRENLPVWFCHELSIPEDEQMEIFNSVERAYRSGTRRARELNVPREITVKFYDKAICQKLLSTLNQKARIVEGRQLRFLREIPFGVRRRRAPYRELSVLLLRNNVRFTWILPEGLFFTYNAKRFRITTIKMMRDFLQRFGEDLGRRGNGDGPRHQQEKRRSSPSEDLKKKQQEKRLEVIQVKRGVLVEEGDTSELASEGGAMGPAEPALIQLTASEEEEGEIKEKNQEGLDFSIFPEPLSPRQTRSNRRRFQHAMEALNVLKAKPAKDNKDTKPKKK